MRPVTAVFGVLILAASAGLAVAGAPEGVARCRTRAVRSGGTTIAVNLTVDVASLSAGGQTVALGGYAIAVEFDPAAVELLSVGGGNDPLFSSTPFSTNVGKANATGHLRVVGVQTSSFAPVGEVSVAEVRFAEKQANGASTIRIHLEEAASSLVHGADGSLASVRLPVANESVKQETQTQ